MEDWDEFDDEPEDEEDSEDNGEDEDNDGDEIDADDNGEDGEDLIAWNAIGAMLEIDGDSEVARESRAALSAISDSAMALKARRQAREQREALEQEAERERLEAVAQKEEERARREAQERADQRAEAERQERARLAQEAQQLALERERLRIEQEQFEARRREEAALKAAPTRTPAHIPPRTPVEPEWPAHKNRKEVPRRRHHEQAEARRTADRGHRQVSVQEDEATRAARLQQRALEEQRWREAVQREEEARKTRQTRAAARTVQSQPSAIRSPKGSRRKTVKRHKTSNPRPDATVRRAERPATPAAQPSRPAEARPARRPQKPPAQRPDLHLVADDFRDAVATATADLLKRPNQAEPPASRPTRPGKRDSLTGADLASWRSRLGLTQSAAASRLGVGQGTVSKAESKGTVPLGPALLRALAAALAREQHSA